MAATPTHPGVIPSAVAIGLWKRHSRKPVIDQLLEYTDDVARLLNTGTVPVLPRAPLAELNLSTMAHNALRRADIFWVDQVELLPVWQLTKLKGIGEHFAHEVVHAVRQYERRQREAPDLSDASLWSTAAAPSVALSTVHEQVESLRSAFYVWTEDNERQAALLMQAADLAAAHGAEHLQKLATALLEHQA